MTEPNQSLVLASNTKVSGLLYLKGFGTPTFIYEMFVKKTVDGKKGWVGAHIKTFINKNGTLAIETPEGIEQVSFRDERSRPVVEFLKTTTRSFPYTLFMVRTDQEIAALHAPLVG